MYNTNCRSLCRWQPATNTRLCICLLFNKRTLRQWQKERRETTDPFATASVWLHCFLFFSFIFHFHSRFSQATTFISISFLLQTTIVAWWDTRRGGGGGGGFCTITKNENNEIWGAKEHATATKIMNAHRIRAVGWGGSLVYIFLSCLQLYNHFFLSFLFFQLTIPSLLFLRLSLSPSILELDSSFI